MTDPFLPSKVAAVVKRWTINIVQVIVAIAVLGVLMEVGMWLVDPDTYYDTYGHTWMSETLSRCDSLEVELDTDLKCLDNRDCTMTRDELAGHEKRLAKMALHCEVSDE